MTISALPTPPSRTDSQATFDSRTEAFIAALPTFVTETNATASAVSSSQTSAASSATAAATSATNAANSASGAAASASAASTSATNAAASASSAAASAGDAAASYDAFDDRYLGSKAANPSVDNDGNALLTGALYWNSVGNEMRVWSGAAWAATYVPSSGYLTTGSIGSTVQAYAANLTSWAALAPSAKQNAIGTISGIAKGNGANALTAATAGTDYDAPGTASTATASRTFQAQIIETPATANTGTNYTVTDRSMHDLTLTGNVVFTFPAAVAGKQFTLLLKQDGTGGRTITWPSAVRWTAGTAPTITAAAGKTDVISFVCDGTYWLGFIGGQNYTRA